MSSLLRVKFSDDTHRYRRDGNGALMDAFFMDLVRAHTRGRERNINMQMRYKYGYLVLKPLTRHYTLIRIFDPYFLLSNQYTRAGSAIPKSIRVHGGGSSSLFASAPELQKRRPADVCQDLCW